jgi:nucleotide-binding universal stress UspA family protein
MVHGYLVPTPCLTPLAPLFDEHLLLAAARDRLAEVARVVRSVFPHVPIDTRAVRASGGEVLVQESWTASLVVIGAPRLGGKVGAPAGSVAAHLVANARCPVLVARPSQAVPPQIPDGGPVLVGVDGHEPSAKVLNFAFEEASVRGVALVAVHVWSVPELVGLSRVGSGAAWASDPDQAQLQMHQNAERVLAEALAGWQERYPHVTVRRWVVHSFGGGRVLLDVARAVDAGLLVVGSRGRGALAGAVFGSVSQVLMNHADAPVAVIGPLVCPRPVPQPRASARG